AARLEIAFVTPNVAMKESAAAVDAMPKSFTATIGSTARSRPTIAPTNPFTTTSNANWRQLADSPSWRSRDSALGCFTLAADASAPGARCDIRGLSPGLRLRCVGQGFSIGPWRHRAAAAEYR